MKRITRLATTIICAAALTFVSCKKDETTDGKTAPTLSVNGGAAGMNLDGHNDTVAIMISATANGTKTIKTVTITKALGSAAAVTIFTSSPGTNKVDTTIWDIMVAPKPQVGDIFTYTVKVTDDKDISTTQGYIVTVIRHNGVITSTLIELGAQSDTLIPYKFLGIADNFATYTAGPTGTAKANSAKIDFVYYYGASDNNAFASPSNTNGAQVIWSAEIGSWGTKNNTLFKTTTITSTTFDSIMTVTKTDDAFQMIDFSNNTTDKITGLKVNDVFAFQTANGKKGIVKFSNVAADNKGSIKLNIVCQN